MDGASGGLNFITNVRFSNGLVGDGDQDPSLFAIGVDTSGTMNGVDQRAVAKASPADERSQNTSFFAIGMDGAGGLKVSPSHEFVVLPVGVGVNQDPSLLAVGVHRFGDAEGLGQGVALLT